MGATINQLTVEEFDRLAEETRTGKRELDEGAVVETIVARSEHELARTGLLRPLFAYTEANPVAEIFCEAEHLAGPASAYLPDISVMLIPRLRGVDIARPFDGAPDIAVEIVSSEPAWYLMKKTRAYLASGSAAVWIAYPRLSEIHVWRRNGSFKAYVPGEILEEPEVLPGFQLAIERVFSYTASK